MYTILITVTGGFLGVLVKYSQQMFPNTDHIVI